MILEKINMRRKKCNETELEEQKIVAESTEAGTSASLAAKLLREDRCVKEVKAKSWLATLKNSIL